MGFYMESECLVTISLPKDVWRLLDDYFLKNGLDRSGCCSFVEEAICCFLENDGGDSKS